jgi:hypothetical protein
MDTFIMTGEGWKVSTKTGQAYVKQAEDPSCQVVASRGEIRRGFLFEVP